MSTVIEKLRTLLHIEPNASEEDIHTAFNEIAKILINQVCIRRGGKTFYIDEIEFYFYNKNHRDLITYPRNTKALQWYRNAFFGVDITFDSHVDIVKEGIEDCFSLDKDPAFGGVLIRKLSSNGEIISAPRLCANVLFDVLDATTAPSDYPVIAECEQPRNLTIKTAARTNILSKNDAVSDKVHRIVYNNFIAGDVTPEMEDDFEKFVGAGYKYYGDSISKLLL